jgi:hypothetical protein
MTQANGRFEYVWVAEVAGSHAIRAGWSGNALYTGAMSAAKNATVIPLFLTVLVGVAVVAAVVGVVAVLVARHRQQYVEPAEPQPW